MIPLTKASQYFYQMATGDNRVGNNQREREREEQINGVRVLERFGNGVGLEMVIGKGHLSISNRSE